MTQHVLMPYLCDGCGEEMEIWVNGETIDIDPPYFCKQCRKDMDAAEEPERDDDLDWTGSNLMGDSD